jgi:autotransporter translocation and assembly factor TamB
MTRRLVHALLIVLTLVIGATAAAIIVTQTAWFKNQLRAYIVSEANLYLNGKLSIERLSGNLFYGVEMEGIGITLDGQEVVSVKDIGLDYNAFDLISRGVSLDRIRLNQPSLLLEREGDHWSISRLIKRQAAEAERMGPAYPISIDAIGITDASIVVDDPVGTTGIDVPNRFDRVDAELSFKYDPVHYTVEIASASFRGAEPDFGLNALSGGVSVRDDTLFLDRISIKTEESSLSIAGAVQHYLATPVFNLEMSSDKLSLPELATVVPALAGIRLQPAFELKLSGPTDALSVDMNVRSTAGQATAQLMADLAMPGQSAAGHVSVRHLDLAPLLNDPHQRTDLTGDADGELYAARFSDLDAVRGTVTVRAPRVVVAGYAADNVKGTARINGRRIDLRAQGSAYRAAGTANGRVTLPGPATSLAYDLRGRVRHLDLRRLPPALDAPATETNVTADYHVQGSQPRFIQGELRFDESTAAGMRIARGSTLNFAKRGADLEYQADASVSSVDLQRLGREFHVEALTADRYHSSLNANLRATGRGTRVSEMELTATGTMSDSEIFGGRVPSLSFDIASNQNAAHVKAAGAFTGIDPAMLSGRPSTKGSVTGTLDVDGTIDGVSTGATLDNVAGTARMALESSTIGEVVIDRGTIDGDYRNRSGEIRQFEIAGPDVNLTASGSLALNEQGESNLTFASSTPNLEKIGQLFDTPVTGIGEIKGDLTGNRTALVATGTMVASGLKYRDNGALSLSGNFTARVPDLTLADTEVTADTRSTFVTIAGQNINELTVKGTYRDKTLEFDATARQPERSLAAGGSLIVHPDHREVHLQRLTLDTKGLAWQMAPGSEASIQYASDVIAVHNATLVSGDQTITADGSFGRPGDSMAITMTNVDLAGIDTLLLRPPQFTGRLDAAGALTGTREVPQLKGDFRITKGGFRKFQYESFAGNVDYVARGLTVDVRLQQDPTQWITAKGYWGMAPASRVDLAIDSSPIDLGIVQGLVPELTDVRGLLEAHVHITGSADDPHPEGVLTVRDGAATIPRSGVSYAHIAGRVDLQPDRVHIDEFTVLDNHDSSLSLTGDLAIHQRQVGDVKIYITADDFKVVDNELGNVRIQSRMEIAGELRTPRLEGYLGVSSGEINLDEIIALTGPSAYSTTPIEFVTPVAAEKEEPAAANLFDALEMDLHVTVPNDLIVKSANLQTPQSPIGLGALNVTLGGDLRATKTPGEKMRLVGIVNTVRGSYDFQGRRFEILRDGSIRFDGLDDLDPALDIKARRVIQAVEAQVNIRGTLKEPEIVLSSNPPQEQADVLSLIVFNQPINQLGEGDQIALAMRAQGLATSAVTGRIAQSIGQALNIDTFEIDLTPESGKGPQVTVGQQIGRKLYMKVEQGVGEQGATNFILEYDLTEWLRLQTNVVQDATTQQSRFRRRRDSGADLIFFFSY